MGKKKKKDPFMHAARCFLSALFFTQEEDVD